MTGSGIAAGLAALITLRIAQPIRFGIQERVQRLLHRAPDHPIQVILDPLVVNRNDIAQRTRCILGHGGSFLLTWLRLATSSSARFGAASPTQLCERNRTSSPGGKALFRGSTVKSRSPCSVHSYGTKPLLLKCLK